MFTYIKTSAYNTNCTQRAIGREKVSKKVCQI
jgi:hypothetical protein